jgi:hypothetical protein
MTGAAKVQAIDAVDTLAIALRRYQEETASILEELQMQVNHAVDWVEHDLKTYWKDAERRAYQNIAEARVQLEQARISRRIAEFEPACREEKKALERAQQRLRVAQAKLDKLRHWTYAVNRAAIEFQAGIGPLGLFLESDLPRGLAALRHMTLALESYVALLGPEVPADLIAASPAPDDGPAAAVSQAVAEPAPEPGSDAAEQQPIEEQEPAKNELPEVKDKA